MFAKNNISIVLEILTLFAWQQMLSMFLFESYLNVKRSPYISH